MLLTLQIFMTYLGIGIFLLLVLKYIAKRAKHYDEILDSELLGFLFPLLYIIFIHKILAVIFGYFLVAPYFDDDE